jgi:hypothetical protein
MERPMMRPPRDASTTVVFGWLQAAGARYASPNCASAMESTSLCEGALRTKKGISRARDPWLFGAS